MICDEMRRSLTQGVGDLLTEKEIEALFDWHARACKACFKGWRLISQPTAAELDPDQQVIRRHSVWTAEREKLLRSARGKLNFRK